MHKASCDAELQDEYGNVDQEDYSDDLHEHGQDGEDLSDKCHVQENAEDVEGEERDDGRLDGLDDHLFEVVYGILQCLSVK